MVDGDTAAVLAGRTSGDFSGVSQGDVDIIAIKVDAASGAEIWRYQVFLEAPVSDCRRNSVNIDARKVGTS